MRKNIFIASIFFATIILTIASCKKSDSSNASIVGKWKATFRSKTLTYPSNPSMNSTTNNDNPGDSSEYTSSGTLKEYYGGTLYTSTYVVSGNQLIVTESGGSYTGVINKLDGNTLELTFNDTFPTYREVTFSRYSRQ